MPLTPEWVDKAEGDFHSALRELRARKNPDYDSACFHAQQCAEKYLKAVLVRHQVEFPKTHDLKDILKLIAGVTPSLAEAHEEAKNLTRYGVTTRYPSGLPGVSERDAREAARIAGRVRDAVRARLADVLD